MNFIVETLKTLKVVWIKTWATLRRAPRLLGKDRSPSNSNGDDKFRPRKTDGSDLPDGKTGAKNDNGQNGEISPPLDPEPQRRKEDAAKDKPSDKNGEPVSSSQKTEAPAVNPPPQNNGEKAGEKAKQSPPPEKNSEECETVKTSNGETKPAAHSNGKNGRPTHSEKSGDGGSIPPTGRGGRGRGSKDSPTAKPSPPKPRPELICREFGTEWRVGVVFPKSLKNPAVVFWRQHN